jgi:hypothetical protein
MVVGDVARTSPRTTLLASSLGGLAVAIGLVVHLSLRGSFSAGQITGFASLAGVGTGAALTVGPDRNTTSSQIFWQSFC